MHKWKIIKEFLRKNIVITILTLLSGLCYNVFTAIIPISLGRFYEFNFGFSSHRLVLLNDLPFINTSNFEHFVLFFIGLIFVRFVFEYLNRFLIGLMGEKLSKSLREQLFSRQLNISNTIYEDKGVGKYLLRYSADFKSIRNYLTKGLFKFTQDLILIVILILVIAYLNVIIALIITGFILLGFGALLLINTTLYKISLQKRNKNSNVLSFVSKVLNSILTIKVLNKKTPIETRYNKRSLGLFNLGVKYQKTIALIHSLIPLLTYTMIAAVMFYIHSIKSHNNDVDQASLLILILVIITFLPIFRRILNVNIVWKLGNISFSKLLNIYSFSFESDILQKEINLNNCAIEFKNVWINANKNISLPNFKFTPQSISFLKINSGSKDSQLFIKLLLKIYKPIHGNIFIGKHNVNDLSEKTIRKFITVVSKDIPLEGRTVFEAISYSLKAGKRERSKKILDDLQQFIPVKNHLTLDTKIGESSGKLSNSQIQLLIWCRALLTNKSVLVLDMPFNFLNIKLKNYLYKKLNNYKKRKTIILLDKKNPEKLSVDSEIFFNLSE